MENIRLLGIKLSGCSRRSPQKPPWYKGNISFFFTHLLLLFYNFKTLRIIILRCVFAAFACGNRKQEPAGKTDRFSIIESTFGDDIKTEPLCIFYVSSLNSVHFLTCRTSLIWTQQELHHTVWTLLMDLCKNNFFPTKYSLKFQHFGYQNEVRSWTYFAHFALLW